MLPGQTGQAALSVSSADDAAPGSYSVSVMVSDVAGSEHNGSGDASYTVLAPTGDSEPPSAPTGLAADLKLKHVNPGAYFVASIQQTQQEADKIIRRHIPWRGWRDLPSGRKGIVGDFQMAGQYSLDACQGGGGHHRISPERKPRAHEQATGKYTLRSVTITEDE